MTWDDNTVTIRPFVGTSINLQCELWHPMSATVNSFVFCLLSGETVGHLVLDLLQNLRIGEGVHTPERGIFGCHASQFVCQLLANFPREKYQPNVLFFGKMGTRRRNCVYNEFQYCTHEDLGRVMHSGHEHLFASVKVLSTMGFMGLYFYSETVLEVQFCRSDQWVYKGLQGFLQMSRWYKIKLVKRCETCQKFDFIHIFIHIHTLFIPFCWMISSCCFFFGSFLNFSFSPGKYRDIDGTNLDNVALARKRLVRNGKMETREWWKVGTQQADDSFNAMFFCDYFVLI